LAQARQKEGREGGGGEVLWSRMGVVLTRAEVVKGLEPVASFNVDRVRSMFQEFEDVCSTPALWERAFYELLGCFANPEQCARGFAVLDTDGNGFIDARETLGALAVISKGHLTDRMALVYDIFDLNKQKEMAFDECFLMLRRTMAGLRKIIGILTPPEKVIHNMTKQVWKQAKKHRDSRILPDEWQAWWSSDSSIRSALKMVIWKPEDQRGLPTPDQLLNYDYTRSAEENRKGEEFGDGRQGSRPSSAIPFKKQGSRRGSRNPEAASPSRNPEGASPGGGMYSERPEEQAPDTGFARAMMLTVPGAVVK